MRPVCLSDGSCKELCDVCINSYNRYVSSENERRIKEAVFFLKSQGYTVRPPSENE